MASHGLGSASIGAVATAVPLGLADPRDFDLSRHGLIDFSRIIVPPAILAVAAYLKQSPLPSTSLNRHGDCDQDCQHYA